MKHTHPALRAGLTAVTLTALLTGCQTPGATAAHATPRPVHTVTTDATTLAADAINATELREQSATATKDAHAKVVAAQAAADQAAKAAADAAAAQAAAAAANAAAAATKTAPKTSSARTSTTTTKPSGSAAHSSTSSQPAAPAPATAPPDGATIHVAVQSCVQSGANYIVNVSFSYSNGWHDSVNGWNIGTYPGIRQVTIGSNLYDLAESSAFADACLQ